MGLGTENPMIVAMTGFQRKYYSRDDLQALLLNAFQNNNLNIEYVQRSLLKIKGLYDGGHISINLREQVFRLEHDSRRLISNPLGLDPAYNLLNSLP
jgi:hypothetical protein